MKKFITIALAAVIAISANAKKVNTAVFNSVKVNAPVHLVIVPSREYSVNVTYGASRTACSASQHVTSRHSNRQTAQWTSSCQLHVEWTTRSVRTCRKHPAAKSASQCSAATAAKQVANPL